MTVYFAPRRPAHVAAAVVLGVETAAVAVGAVLYVAFGIVGDSGSAGLSFALAAMMALAAVGLGFLARGLWRARRWAVSPSITWQVLQGFVGAYAISIGSTVQGVIALVLAVVALGVLVLIARSQASAA